MTRTDLSARIHILWPSIVEASGCRPEALDCLPSGPLTLFGSSTKTEKGEGRGILTAVVYLSPADASGRNVCPKATSACRAGCLGLWSGRMVMAPVKRAQLWKTALRLGAPGYFRDLARLDIRAHEARARKLNLIPAVRMDGTSDLGDGWALSHEFVNVSFYDYTKREAAALRGTSNYHATLSFSGENLEACRAHLRAGGTVAVPFAIGKGERLPLFWEGYSVIDGDVSDYRPADEWGTVVGLRWKGPRKTRDAAQAAGWAQ